MSNCNSYDQADFSQSPSEVVIHKIDWTLYGLNEDATIISQMILPSGPTDYTISAISIVDADKATQFTLTGGIIGTRYYITNRVSTSDGEVLQHIIIFDCISNVNPDASNCGAESGKSGGYGVLTVTGLDTDNTDSQNPVIRIAVDDISITGTGTPDDPLVANVTAGVSSVFGRTGAVVAQTGDYTTGQVPESGNLYFTNARAIAATLTDYSPGAGVVASSDSILQAIQKIVGNITNVTNNYVPITRTVNGHALSADVTVTKSDVGLSAVTNDAQIALANLSTDGTFAGASNTKVPSQLATKTYVDNQIDAANALQYKGVIDCSTNPNYPAANAGWMYLVSVSGKIGGASGIDVEAGDMVICLVDNSPAGNQAAVGANWNIIQKNIDGYVLGPASSTIDNFASYNAVTGKVIKDSGVSAASFLGVNANAVSASKWLTARLLAGNSVDGSANVPFSNKFIVQGTADAGLSGAQFLGSLATGLMKNTTSTGVITIAVAGSDYVIPSGLTGLVPYTGASNDVALGVHNITAGNLSGTNTGDQTITLTGDIIGSGTGSFATAIAAGVIVDADINASAAIDATKIANGSVTSTEFQYLDGVTSAIQTQLNGKQATGNYITALTGDATAAGPGSVGLTLATVNANVGSFGSASQTVTITTNAKGLITAISQQTVVAPAGTLSGTTLNSTVVSSSLTSVGAQTQNLDMNTHKIVNVTDPTSPQDAATKSYVDASVTGLLDYRGSYDASTNLFPTTGGSGTGGIVWKGDFWICSVPGTLGGEAVTAGDLIIALTDIPGQTAANWDLIEHNIGSYVVSVGGTTNRITSSGGSTPTIDISATFEALLGKVANPLSQFAATTSAQLAGVISDETGSGLLVFNNAPTFIAPVLGTPASGTLTNCTFPTLNQNTTGSAATLTTPRSIYGNNFDGSAALAQIIASTFGGTGNGFTKFTGPTTSEKTFTLPNATATILTTNAVVTGAQGGTGVANTGFTITLGGNFVTSGAFATTLTVGATTNVTLPSTGTLSAIAGTETLTNKRITKRTGTVTSSATPTINTDNVDFYSITALTTNITSMTTNLSGTPTQAQQLWIAITGTGARTITWGASFEASTVALPTTTVSTNRLDVGFVWNTVTSKWRCVSVA